MNLANKITILRIILSFFAMGFILRYTLFSLSLGFLCFLLASFSDFLDGYIARRRTIVSDLGKLLDPLADKVLIIGVFLSFLEKGVVSSWPVILIMVREFLITGLRILALRRRKVIEAQVFGKHKTVTQILAIVVIFLLLIGEKIIFRFNLRGEWFLKFKSLAIFLVMLWVVIVTLFSGFLYLWKNRTLIRSL